MDLIKCPRCGEEYSPSYRRCPFCEEGDHPRRVKYNGSKGGRRVGGTRQTHSVRGAVAAVLVVVVMLLSWSLFGDKIVARIGGDDTPQTEQNGGDAVQNNDQQKVDGENGEGNGEDNAVDPEGGTPPDISGDDTPDANAGDTNTGDGSATTPNNNTATPSVDVNALGVKTNVGTTLSKDANGNFDCTIRMSDPTIRLILTGTDAAPTWTAADTSVLTISADGTITPVKTGMTTVTASVGGVSISCTIRIK